MNEPRPIAEDELQAYVDGRLDSARIRAVEAYLAQAPAAAERTRAYGLQRAALREALAPVAAEPIPPELDVDRLLQARRRAGQRWRAATGVAACVVLGVGAGWFGRGLADPPRAGVGALAQEAADSYRVYAADTQRPVELAASDEKALTAWVSRRLRRPVTPPDLTRAGYRLMGGRLVATAHGPAALFLYDDLAGARLAVFVRPMRVERDTRMSEHAYGDLGGVAWAADGIGYGLVGTAPAGRLHPIADDVRRQLSAADHT